MDSRPTTGAAPTVGGAPRVSPEATRWLKQLARADAGDARLVRVPDGAVYVLEGGLRRRVRSGLLAAALEDAMGAAAAPDPAAWEASTDGPPVEIVADAAGARFVVVGGERLPVRGLPVPHLADAGQLDRFPVGDTLDVAHASVPRRRYEELSARAGGGSGSVVRRVGRRVRRAFRG